MPILGMGCAEGYSQINCYRVKRKKKTKNEETATIRVKSGHSVVINTNI